MLIKMREMMRRKDNQKGFTLVELIVVMAILAVLAALAVPRFTNVLGDSKIKANDANIEMITRAVEMYIASESAGDVTDFAEKYEDGLNIDDDSELIPDYLREVPLDPTDGSYYQLEVGASPDYEVTVTDDGENPSS